MGAVEACDVEVVTQGSSPGHGMGTSGEVRGPLRRVEVLKYQEGAMDVMGVTPGAVSERTSSSWYP